MIRGLIGIGLDNPVLLNLLFVASLVLGLLAAWRLPKEEFPAVDTEQVAVIVAWPGASPEDLEALVVRPMEDALDEVDGLEHVYTKAAENVVTLRAEMLSGADIDQAQTQIERAVGGVGDLPEGVEEVRVVRIERRIPVAHVGLTGDLTRADLVDRLSDELTALPGVSEVEVRGDARRVLRVELDPAPALVRGITPDRVAAALKAATAGAPAGRVDLSGQRVLVRTPKGFQGADDLSEVPLVVGDGSVLRVGDVARVVQRFEEPDVTYRIDGQPAVDLTVHLVPDGDALAVEPGIRDWADQARTTLPPGLGLVVYDDGARVVRDRIQILASNGVAGAILVAVCLVVFIGWRSAGLVVWGLPVAYAGALVAMWLSGDTVNVISTFALLLVTGIIVDDAIIITENVQRHLEMGKGRVAAALDGTAEVAGAVFAATLTTCLAFAPLAMLDGVVGRVMAIVPSVVIFSLLASLIEAFVILPGHLAHYAAEGGGVRENLATRWIKALYAPVLRTIVGRRARWGALAGLLLFLAAVAGLGATMRLTLQTPGNPYFVRLDLTLPVSATPAQTEAAAARAERFVLEQGTDLVIWTRTTLGRQDNEASFPTVGPHVAQVKIGFRNDPATFDAVPAFVARIDAELSQHTALVSYGRSVMQGGPPSGADIDIQVRSRDRANLPAAASVLAEHLRSRPGVSGVRGDNDPGAETFRIDVDPERARRLGVREADVAQAARMALDGALAVQIPLDERLTDVEVAWRGVDRPGLESLGDVPVVASSGAVLRLRDVADVQRTRGARVLERTDGRPALRLIADVDEAVTTGERERRALDEVLTGLRTEQPDLDLFVGGALADSNESFAELPWAFLLSIGAVYIVLAVQFRSYIQPLVILAAVPLGLAGMVLGLAVLGMDLSFIALIGGVGLVGIVVNDSLVLVEFINVCRARGLSAEDAVIEAGLLRLRPILVTTATTVLGLAPLALGIAGSEPLLAPMAVSIAFGLAFATGLTLVAIPVVYLIVGGSPRA